MSFIILISLCIDSVTHKVRGICDYLEMPNHILGHLRHSQTNYLYEIGCSDEMIIAITGHNDPQTLRNHYKESRNRELANEGISKINKIRQRRESDK